MSQKEKGLSPFHAEYLRLLDFIAQQPLGALVEYKTVEDATGISMGINGRARLRRAIERSDRGALVMPNVGYQLDSPQLATTIAGVQLVGVVNKSTTANKRVRRQLRRFVNDLQPEDRAQLVFVDAQVSAIRIAADSGFKSFLQKRPALKDTSGPIEVPDV